MKKAAITLGLVMVLLVGIPGWEVAEAYLANSELQSDMNDLATQNSARIGLSAIATEGELRDAIISKAKEHGIQLLPDQVMVNRSLTNGMLGITLAADYAAPINLPGLSFNIRFAPSSVRYSEIVVK